MQARFAKTPGKAKTRIPGIAAETTKVLVGRYFNQHNQVTALQQLKASKGQTKQNAIEL